MAFHSGARRPRRNQVVDMKGHRMTRDSQDVIVKTLARLLVSFIVVYALYVVMHGHHSPGGGFQGGVILAAGFVLLGISHGFEKTRKRMSEKLAGVISSIGVLVYGGIGVLCLILGGNYLDYGRLSKLLLVTEAEARSLGILGIEIGVALAVMAVMCVVFFAIYTAGESSGDDRSVK
ncbi:MAG: Na(+)/H(+) antiporter subunit B [Deltaproteobacteria bacterium]|nr:Na(+)/H(+) antiporter subunit B [Deltaproteobacteria bacterium]